MHTVQELYEHYKSVRRRILSAKPIPKPKIEMAPPTVISIAEFIEARQEAERERAIERVMKEEPDFVPLFKPCRFRAKVVEVAERNGVTVANILGPSRKANIVLARQEAMYELRNMGLSYPMVGRKLGGLDHSTCIYGYRKHLKRLKRESENGTAG